MKKKALRKEFWMAVRKSKGRFFSIFFIVALGVAFFSGIRSSEPDMRISGDTYYDETNMMDLKVQGTMGLTEDDITALSKVEGVERVEGGYSVDAVTKIGQNEKVVHIQSDLPTINDISVSKGRMPETVDEILLDEDFMESSGYQIGDKIRFSSGTADEITDSLASEEYEIVGAGSSSCYISFERGSSLIGNGEIAGFAVVLPDAFSMDVYTEAYLLVEGAREETAYTDGYDERVKEVKERVEDIADARCEERLSQIREEADIEISDSEQELQEAREEADRQLAEAGQKISDSEKQLSDGRQQVVDGQKALASGKEEIDSRKGTLQEAKDQYESGMRELQTGKDELDAQRKSFQAKRDAAYDEFDRQEAILKENEEKLAQTSELIESGEAEIAKQEPKLEEARKSLEEGKEKLNAAKEIFLKEKEKAEAEIAEKEQEIQEGQEKLDELSRQIEEMERQIEENPDLSDILTPVLEDLKKQWKEGDEKLQDARQQIEEAKTQLKEKEEELNIQEAKLAEMEKTLESSERMLAEKKEQLADAKVQYQAGIEKLNAGKQALLDAKEEAEKGFAMGEAQIQEAEAKLQSAETQLMDAENQIISGEKLLSEAENLLAEKENQLSEAQQAILSGEKELAEGKEEYEKQKREAEEQFKEAEQKIADARAELDEIGLPTWYVSDRDILTEYTSYGENADRMRAIGEVFPELFFLVAALISLTTMTRMVEEERGQIGTLKALGYGKKSIAGKYLLYALLATLGGSVLGVLVGEKALPYIIIYSYRIMYTHLPHIVIPYQWSYAAMATAAALACTLLATLYACYKALAAQPAELMRPPSPKEGKRILLERIGFIWKHLSFIWKSTIRNLFRYKKRLFMTLAGIGGCMALMVVGFGLKDSIMCIGTLQYQELQVYDGMVYLSDTITDQEKADTKELLSDMKNADGYAEADMRRVQVSANDQGDAESVYQCIVRDKDDISRFLVFRDRKSQETYELTDDGVILTEKMAKTLDVKKGDKIYLGAEGEEKKEVTVTDICENYMEHYVYMTENLYEEVYGAVPEYNTLLFDLKDNSQKKLDQTGEKILKQDGVMNVTYTNSIEDQLNTMLKSLNLVIVVLIISAGMLAFVVLYNLNNINITERRRELATLKVLGFYDNEVSSYVYRENILLTFLSILIGMGLGWILHRFVITTVEVDVVMFGRVINWQSYLYSALFTVAFSLFVNWVMYYKLKKIDMVESMKSVE